MVQASQCYFQVDLRTPAGDQAGEALLPFRDLEAACRDVYDSLPSVAAELMRDGIDPLACSYLVRDEAGTVLLEIEFGELVRGSRRPPPASDDLWLRVNARLRRRSEEAVTRAAYATRRLSALIARAGAVGEAAALSPPGDPAPGSRGSATGAAARPAARDRPGAGRRRPG